MVWRGRHYPGSRVWSEFDDLMNEMENRFATIISETNRLPSFVSSRVLPAVRGECRIDVREHGDEVIVVADLPGVEKEDVSVRFIEPDMIEVSCERKQEASEGGEREGYYMRERVYGSMSRTVALPSDVTDEGVSATFKNGVLEVRMQKVETARGKQINIE